MRKIWATFLGFTIIELLITVSIITVLSSVVLVSLGESRDKARIASAMQFDANFYHALGDEIVGHWDFQEGLGGSTAKDVSGHGNDGTLAGNPLPPTWSTACYHGSSICMTFDSNNQSRVTVQDSSSLNVGLSNFSVSFWVKLSNTNLGTIIGKSEMIGAELLHGWIIRVIDGNPCPCAFAQILMDDGTNSIAPTFLKLYPGRWHHVAIVFDRSQPKGITAYQDGKPQACSSNCDVYDLTTIGDISTTHHLGIGSRDPVSNRGWFLNGDIDDIRLYRKSLKQAQVQELYAAGALLEMPLEEAKKHVVAKIKEMYNF